MPQFTRLNQVSRSRRHCIHNIKLEHSRFGKSLAYKHFILGKYKFIRLEHQLEAMLAQQRSKDEVLPNVWDMQDFSEGNGLFKGKPQLYYAFLNDLGGWGVPREYVYTFPHYLIDSEQCSIATDVPSGTGVDLPIILLSCHVGLSPNSRKFVILDFLLAFVLLLAASIIAMLPLATDSYQVTCLIACVTVHLGSCIFIILVIWLLLALVNPLEFFYPWRESALRPVFNHVSLLNWLRLPPCLLC